MTSTTSTRIFEPLATPQADDSVLERWRVVAERLSGRTALTSPGASYSYGEADAHSDKVAAGLLTNLRNDETVVSMLVSHSAEAIIGLLGVLKAGRAVVFLDAHLPIDRLRLITELAGTATCLTDSGNAELANGLGQSITGILSLQELMDAPSVPPGRPFNLQAIAQENGFDLAKNDHDKIQEIVSIVFTSGSTGRPKGVVQTNGTILNDAVAHHERFGIDQRDRVALVLPYGFAAGSSLLFGALLNGAEVASYDPRDGGTRGLVSWLNEARPTTFHCTPHLLRSLVGVLPATAQLTSLRLVSTVGEAVQGRDVAAIRAHVDVRASFFNWTGSSEIGCLAFHEIAGDGPLPTGNVPAGQPVPNKSVRILRDDGTIAAVGEIGEIITVSDYLSGGYLNDDEGNAARFGFDAEGRRFCRQGDLGRFDHNGDLLLVGRADAAVKVRGYLVEPTEVEAAILTSDSVKEAVVVAILDPAPTRLVAFVVPHSDQRLQSPAALRLHLRTQLPEYMIPSVIVPLVELPRNERGKVDRTNLPVIETRSRNTQPSTQWEIVVADLWSEVLGLSEIGLEDDFMALGGDSLLAEEMLALVQDRFGVAMVSTDLIEAPTLGEFTRRVNLGSAALPSHPDVVALSSSGNQTPLFCFAGSGALALSFLPLSRHLQDRPIYAFQAHGLERRAVPDWTVEAASRRYLEIMRVLRPRGPYLLLGHSFGGLVALDIARQLTAAGEQVDLVGLLDTYLPRSAGPEGTAEAEQTVDDKPGIKKRLKLPPAVPRQIAHFRADRLPPIGQWNRQFRAYLAGVVPRSGHRQFEAFFDQGVITGRKYRLRPYAGRSLFVKASNNPDGEQAWDDYLIGSRTFVNVSSEHSSLLREPHATKLAGVLHNEFDCAAR